MTIGISALSVCVGTAACLFTLVGDRPAPGAACAPVLVISAMAAPAADVRTAVQRALAQRDTRDKIRAVQAALDGVPAESEADAARAIVDLVFRGDEPQALLDVGVSVLSHMTTAPALDAATKAANNAYRKALLAEALGRSEATGAMLYLATMTSAPEVRVRAAAVSALADRNDEGRRAPLRAALDDPEWTVRSGAIRGIGRSGDATLARDLTWHMRRSEGRELDDCAAALAALTGKRFGADPGAYERRMDPPLEGSQWTTPPWSFTSPLLATHSRRILFVVQASETMKDPVTAGGTDQATMKAVAEVGEDLAAALREAKTKADLARVHLAVMLRTLVDGVRFDVMSYSDSPVLVFGELTPADNSSRKKAESRVSRLSSAGQPNLSDTLLRIYDPRGKDPYDAPDGPDTVVIFSDGTLPTRGLNDRTEVVPQALRWNRSRQIQFLVVSVGQSDPSVVGALAGGPPAGGSVEIR